MVYDNLTSTIWSNGGHKIEGVAASPEITGGGFDTWRVTDALFCGTGFGFNDVEVTVAELLIAVAFGVAHTTTVFSTNCAELPLVRADAVQVTCPFPPTSGVVQLQPLGAVIDWNTVELGTEVVSVRFAASLGPLLVAVIV